MCDQGSGRARRLACLALCAVMLFACAGAARAEGLLEWALGALLGGDGASDAAVIGGADGPTAIFIAGKYGEDDAPPDEDGWYNAKEDVALYVHTYNHLPDNFISKNEARKLGWSGGSLERYAPGKSIGGDAFGNREGLLPKAKGRTYTECDIDTAGRSSRGAKRIVFSNDGLIYYTGDHYESFELLYNEEGAVK